MRQINSIVVLRQKAELIEHLVTLLDGIPGIQVVERHSTYDSPMPKSVVDLRIIRADVSFQEADLVVGPEAVCPLDWRDPRTGLFWSFSLTLTERMVIRIKLMCGREARGANGPEALFDCLLSHTNEWFFSVKRGIDRGLEEPRISQGTLHRLRHTLPLREPIANDQAPSEKSAFGTVESVATLLDMAQIYLAVTSSTA